MKHTLTFLIFLTITNVCYNSQNICSYQPQISRKIDNLGFHRNIYYNISLKNYCKLDYCKFCLQDTLPSGLFVNKDQIQDFFRLGKLVASVDGNVNIEAPADASPPIVVRILVEIITSEEHFESKSVLPVHVRYHKPQPGGGFQKIIIDKPELYIHCGGELSNIVGEVFLTPCAGPETAPLPFHKVEYSMIEEEDSLLMVQVPIGDSDSLLLVQTVTFFVTAIGSVYIIGVILKI